jgi:hypothetical protein
MSVVRRETSRRWATAVAGTAVLASIPALLAARPVPASALSARDVVALAVRSADVPHQGLVQIDASLGLPALPVVSAQTTILSGTTRVRTWWSTQASWRVDTITGTGEDITVADPAGTGGGVRQWSFENNSVTDVLYGPSLRFPRADDLVPPQAARRLIGWLGPADRVLPLAARRVAGIDAAGARLVPGDPATTIGHIDLWVDPGSGLPVEVDVYARGGARPALSSRFLDVDLTRPAPDVLSPTFVSTAEQFSTTDPDLLARVNSFGTVRLPDRLGALRELTGSAAAGLHGVAAYGEGLTRVFVIPLPDRLAGDVYGAVGPDSTSATRGTQLTAPGGQATLLSTPLLSLAVVAGLRHGGQGYLVAGDVTPSALRAAVVALLAWP